MSAPVCPDDALESLEHTPRRLLRIRRIADALASHFQALVKIPSAGCSTDALMGHMIAESKAGQLVVVQLLLEIRRVEVDVDAARLYLGTDDELEGGEEIGNASDLLAPSFWESA